MKKLRKKLPTERLFNNKLKIIVIFILLLFCLSIVRIHNIIKNEGYLSLNKYESLEVVETENIIKTSDGKILAMDNKNRDFYLNKKYIDIDRLDLFFAILENNTKIKLTKQDKLRIKEDFKKRNRVLIKKGMERDTVKDIKNVVRLFKKVGFLKYFTAKSGKKYLYGPEFSKSTEGKRVYSDSNGYYQPFLGFVNNENKGVFGVEKYLDKYNKNSLNITRKSRSGVKLYSKEDVLLGSKDDDMVINLTLDDKLQKRLRDIIEDKNKELQAENILVSVVEVSSGEIKGISQLKYFDANNIGKGDTSNMKDFYTNYRYEVGSVIKPITLAISLEEGLVGGLGEVIDTSNGYMYIGRKRITDEHRYENMTAKEVIVHSSNVGISRIALKMNNGEFLKGLEKLWFFKDDNLLSISGENKQYYMRDSVKEAIKKNKLIQRATTSYGYGFMMTPYNLQRMYNVFFNNGELVDFRMLKRTTPHVKSNPVFSKETLWEIKESLVGVVEEGTGKAAKLEGFSIYGKTGTSHIASKSGKYENEYHATFIGAVEDKNGKKYNILVTVVKPQRRYRFASISAVPIFKEVVKELFLENKIKIKF